MKRRFRYLASIALLGSLTQAETSSAATTNANFRVIANVGTSCIISVPADLNFGAYDPVAAAPLDATTNIDVTCTNGTNASIAINEGTNPSAISTATDPDRRMSDGSGQYLYYSLYRDASRTQFWGANGNALALTGSGSSQQFTIYGRLWNGQSATAGAFSDPVVATITF